MRGFDLAPIKSEGGRYFPSYPTLSNYLILNKGEVLAQEINSLIDDLLRNQKKNQEEKRKRAGFK